MEDNQEKTVVEIKGIKMEVDLRYARRIDEFRIGDRVKVLEKEYREPRLYPGVIIGFENFKELPTIVVAVLQNKYNEAKIVFKYFNAKAEDMDMVPAESHYIPFEKAEVLRLMDKEIETKKQEHDDLVARKEYFLKTFECYFKDFVRDGDKLLL